MRFTVLPRRAVLLSLFSLFALSACASGKWGFPYRAPLQQGNWVTQAQVDLLEKGMSPAQVQFALGSPTSIPVLSPNRWDYHYFFKPGYGKPVLRPFSLWFENNRLVRWQSAEQPEGQPQDFETQHRQHKDH